MTAAARLAALDNLPATELCQLAESALSALVDVMNRETTLLRAGHLREASILTPDKARLAQDYVGFARTVQRQTDRLKIEAPQAIDRLKWRKTCVCSPRPARLLKTSSPTWPRSSDNRIGPGHMAEQERLQQTAPIPHAA